MYKHPVYKDEAFEFYIQEVDDKVFIHLDVWDYNKSVLLRMAEAFEDIKDACALDGVEEVYAFSPNHKFCLMGGGELIQITEWKRREYGVYKWVTM